MLMMIVLETSDGHVLQLYSRMLKPYNRSSKSSPRFLFTVLQTRAGLQRMTIYHIMCHSIHMFPYKIQICQSLNEDAIHACRNFADAMLQFLDESETNIGNIWFSDELYFHLDGFVNKQNWDIWGTENPHVASSLHPAKLMVLAMISFKGIIEPLFSRANDECYTVP